MNKSEKYFELLSDETKKLAAGFKVSSVGLFFLSISFFADIVSARLFFFIFGIIFSIVPIIPFLFEFSKDCFNYRKNLRILEEKKKMEELDLGRFKNVIDKSKLKPNPDGTFDYNGNLHLNNLNLNSLLEIPIRFRNVYGCYECASNKLKNLEGAPEKVKSFFNCGGNKLISLREAPIEFTEIWCSHNQLLSDFHILDNSEDGLNFVINPFSITEEVIKIVKSMTFEEQIKELDYFKRTDAKAYEMMKKILEDLNLGHGEKTRSMVKISESYDMGHLGL